MTAVSLGMPAAPPPVLAPRRKTRQIKVGKVGVGSESPVSVQSMTTTLTADVNATLQQIAELTASGCDIVRVACPSADDAEALPAIAQKSQIPVIADIHFQPKYVFAAIEAGCAAVRVNPGNIKKFDDQIKEIAQAAKDHGTSIRIGVNAGSLDKRVMEKYGKATPEALVESAVWEASLFEEHDFHDFKISVKHNDPVVMVRAYELLAEAGDWPLHLGVTEAGPAFQGTIKSATAFGALLSQGIGDTIRVSLSAPPVEEVKVGLQILQSLNLRERKLEIVSCPSCGRAQVDVYKLADEVTAGLEGMEVPLRVAVMGCVVNGPGEAREADLGVASGNGKGQIFVKGEVIKTVPESQIVETLIEEAMRIAEGMESAGRLLRARSPSPDGHFAAATSAVLICASDAWHERQAGLSVDRKARSLTALVTAAGSVSSMTRACCQPGPCCWVASGAWVVQDVSAAVTWAGVGGAGGRLAFFCFFLSFLFFGVGVGLGEGVGVGPAAYASASSRISREPQLHVVRRQLGAEGRERGDRASARGRPPRRSPRTSPSPRSSRWSRRPCSTARPAPTGWSSGRSRGPACRGPSTGCDRLPWPCRVASDFVSSLPQPARSSTSATPRAARPARARGRMPVTLVVHSLADRRTRRCLLS